MRFIGALSLTLAVAGCASQPEYFRPTEKVEAESTEGDLVAEYELWTSSGRLGEAKVWSRGAYPARLNGHEQTVLQVTLEIQNQTTSPLRLDLAQTRLVAVQTNEGVLRDVRPTSMSGDTTIAPQQQGRANVFFALGDLQPQHLDAFELAWRVGGGERAYSQTTPFVEEEYYYSYYPYGYGYYYDPFLYSPSYLIHYRPYDYRTTYPPYTSYRYGYRSQPYAYRGYPYSYRRYPYAPRGYPYSYRGYPYRPYGPAGRRYTYVPHYRYYY